MIRKKRKELVGVDIGLKLELVEAVRLGETPGRLEVLGEVVDLFDGAEEGRVDGL
jgi:hypothetical protein